MPNRTKQPLQVVPPTNSAVTESNPARPELEGKSFIIETAAPTLPTSDIPPLQIPTGGSSPSQWEERPPQIAQPQAGTASIDNSPERPPAAALSPAEAISTTASEQVIGQPEQPQPFEQPVIPQPLPRPEEIIHQSSSQSAPEASVGMPVAGVSELPIPNQASAEPIRTQAPTRPVEPLDQIFDPDHKPHPLTSTKPPEVDPVAVQPEPASLAQPENNPAPPEIAPNTASGLEQPITPPVQEAVNAINTPEQATAQEHMAGEQADQSIAPLAENVAIQAEAVPGPIQAEPQNADVAVEPLAPQSAPPPTVNHRVRNIFKSILPGNSTSGSDAWQGHAAGRQQKKAA